jgi:hypothetical protein
VQVGDQLSQDAVVHTGPAGGVVMTIPPDLTLTFDRMSSHTILEAARSGGKVTMNVGQEYGRTRHGISGAGVEHESTIRSTNSTLAVRGTIVSVFDQRPYPPEAVSLTGRAEYTVFKRQAVAVGSRNGRAARVSAAAGTAAETALAAAVVDPFLSAARSDSEAALVDTVLSRGGVITFDQESNIRVVRGGGRPDTPQLTAALPGLLNFVVRWDRDANVDLALSTPGGDFLYPVGGFDRGKGGGVVPFDHRGGTGGGFEVAYFPAGKIEKGTYGFTATSVTGERTTLTLEAYYGGRRLNFDPRADDPQYERTRTVGPGFGASVTVSIPDVADPSLEPVAGAARAARKAAGVSARGAAAVGALPPRKR